MFVSSTLQELAPERAAVRRAVERLGLVAVMFEAGARPHPPRDLYRSYLAQSQVFVGLYWQRYGWVAPGESISGLEDEYRLSAGMPRLIYLKEPAGGRESDLERLLTLVRDDGSASYRPFENAAELEELVAGDLALLLSERFDAGGPDGPALKRYRTPPIPATTTVGRDREISAVAALLAEGPCRLVSVLGPGGIGKSRVGLEVARVVRERFSDGTAFVPLEGTDDPALVTPILAESLRVGEGSAALLDQVVEHLSGRSILLLLDNTEHVLDGVAGVAGRITDECPNVRILATSRRPLRLRGEQEYPLAPLSDAAAARLFVERMQARRPSFNLDEAGRDSVDRLCARLDRLPLAIELAAARARVMGLAALEQRLGDCLDLLGGGPRDLPERHRTLRATLDWSYRLLGPTEQSLLAHLSVFPGGARFDAVQTVCCDEVDDEVLDAITVLLDNALVSPSGSGRIPRVAMPETMQAYAAEKLEAAGLEGEARRRHLRWFRDFAARGDVLVQADPHLAWPEFEEEAANLRAAVQHALELGDGGSVADFSWSLWFWMWNTGRSQEVARWVEQGVALVSPSDAGTRRRMLAMAALCRFFSGDYDGAQAAAQEVLAGPIADDSPAMVAHMALSITLPHKEDVAEARRHAERAYTLSRDRGAALITAYLASILGHLTALTSGDLAAARALHVESMDFAAAHGLEVLAAQAHTQLAMLDLQDDSPASARDRLRQAATICRSLRHHEATSYALDVTAAWAVGAGRAADAVRAQAAARTCRAAVGLATWPMMAMMSGATRRRAVTLLGEDEVAAIEAAAIETDPWTVLDDCLA